jgi:hypothetical protein
VDCGGWCAPQKKCADIMGCLNSYDCISGVCTSNICQGNCVVISDVKYMSLSIAVPTCSDGVMNGNESDVDCGGSCLPSKRCGDGLICNSASDCISGVCKTNICQGESIITSNVKNLRLSITVAACNDGVKNGNETDVDCGGSCLPSKQCGNGLICNNGPDCISGVCTTNICQS